MSQDFANQFNHVLAQAPELIQNPQLAVPVLSAGIDPSDATAVAAFASGKSLANYLTSLSDEAELEAWKKLTKAQQSSTRFAGYTEQFERVQEEEAKGFGAFMKATLGIPFSQIKNAGHALKDAVDVAWDYSIGPTAAGVKDALGIAKDYTIDPTLMSLDSITPDAVVDPIMGALGEGIERGVNGLVVEPAKKIGHGALSAYEFATGSIDQAWRMGVMESNEGPLDALDAVPGMGPTAGIVSAVGSGDLFKKWHAADRDQAPVSTNSYDRLVKEYGEDIVQLGRDFQQNPEAVLQRRADLVSQGRYEEAENLEVVANSPEFADVMDRLGRALLSPGRKMAQEMHLEDNGSAFSLVSGLGDASWRVITDPVLAAGKGVQGYRVARYGLPKGDAHSAETEVFNLFTKQGTAGDNVRRYWSGAAENFKKMHSDDAMTRSAAKKDLERNYKFIDPAMVQAMHKYDGGISSLDDVTRFIMEGENYKFLLSGQSAIRRPLMPYRTQVGEKVRKARTGVSDNRVIDFMRSGHKIIQDDLMVAGAHVDKLIDDVRVVEGAEAPRVYVEGQAGEVGSLIDAQRRGWRGRSATAHRRITTKLPSVDVNGNMDLMAPAAARDIGRVAAMWAPKYWAREVEIAFMQADEVGRKNIVAGLMATMGEATGLTKTVAGREWLADYLSTVKAGRAYTVSGESKLADGREMGVFANDMSTKWRVPNFAEFYAQSAKIAVADRMFGTVNRDMLDWYMQTVWRPAVLLRPALPFRNSIEETLNQLVREGGTKVATGEAAKRYVNSQQYALKAERDVNAKNLDLQHTALHGELTTKYGRDAGTLEAWQTDLRSQADALLSVKARGGGEATRVVARNERRNQADALMSQAAGMQDDLNRFAASRHGANEAKIRAEATPEAFDSTMGSVFRSMTSVPRAMAKALAPIAEKSGSDSFKSIVNTMKNPNGSVQDFYRAHVYGKVSTALIKSAPADVKKFLDELVDNPEFMRMFQLEMMDTARMSSRNQIDNLGAKYAERKGKMSKGRTLVTTGEFALQSAHGAEGAAVWSSRLGHMVNGDPAATFALTHVDDPYTAITGAAKIIEANPAIYGSRSLALEERDALDHATVMFNELKGSISTPDGVLIPQITERLYYTEAGRRVINPDAISPSNLGRVDDVRRPTYVVGGDAKLVEHPDLPMHELVQWGFKATGDMTAFMSRQRQVYTAYVEARQLLAPMENDLFARMGSDAAAKLSARNMVITEAMEMAFAKSLKYVDNPAVRSQAAVLMRNFAPFYRAQEEFFARWATTMKYNPEAWGRAMLGVHAAKSGGIVHKDENGDLYFVYPGSGVIHSAISEIAGVFGLDATRLPIISPMTGKISMLTPGLNPDSSVNILNGPILAEPLRQLARMSKNPTVDEWEKRVLGPGADRGFLHANVPAILRPMYEEYALDNDRHELNALAALVAGGHGPKAVTKQEQDAFLAERGMGNLAEPARSQFLRAHDMVGVTAKEKQRVLDELKAHANGIKAVRSVFGSSLPAYPRMEPATPATGFGKAAGLESIRPEFYDLVKRTGDYAKAYNFWVEAHPDQLPFILGQNEKQGVPFLSTAEAGQFIDSNRKLLKDYPIAGTFFIPHGEGDFDIKAFVLSKQLGLVEGKSTEDYLDDLVVGDGVGFYFREREKIDVRIKDAKDKGDAATADHWSQVWKNWQKGYMAMNPLVQEYMADGGRRANERDEAFAQMRNLLDSPDAPVGPTADMYRKLSNAWDHHKFKLSQIGDARTESQRQQKKAENEAFEKWALRAVGESTAGKLFYDKLIRYNS